MKSQGNNPDSWPSGQSHLAALVREHDWSQTHLGPISSWPGSLRNTVDIVLQSALPMVLLMGPAGVMIYNDSYAAFAGRRHPGLLGAAVKKGWPEVADFNQHVLDEGLAGRTLTFRNQHLILDRGGRPEDVWLDLYYSPVLDDRSRPAGVLAVVVDTTKDVRADHTRTLTETALRLSEERFRTAFAHAATGIALTDLSGRFLRANAAFCKITGYSEEALKGLDLATITHPDDRAQHRELMCQVVSGAIPAYVIEKRYVRPNGTFVWVQKSVSLARNSAGQPENLVAITEDITDRKRAEQALLRSNEELQAFAYAASHDLQEPLRTVASFTQLLARRYQGQLDEKADEYIHHIIAGAKRMQALVTDILAFMKAGRLEGTPVQPVDLGQLGAAVISGLRTAIVESGATIHLHELPVVNGTAQQLDQLVQNLIGNAIKYHRPGVPPHIEVTAEERPGEWLIAVRDNGIGFRQDQSQYIFEVFKRLHGREILGTGIGLALCKRIVERHGGRIWAEAVPEQGATFYFTLPR